MTLKEIITHLKKRDFNQISKKYPCQLSYNGITEGEMWGAVENELEIANILRRSKMYQNLTCSKIIIVCEPRDMLRIMEWKKHDIPGIQDKTT